MDWLFARKEQVEKALVSRYLGDGSLVCYDLSSSRVEGSHNKLEAFGDSRDAKRGKRQIAYVVVPNTEGLACASRSSPPTPRIRRASRRFAKSYDRALGSSGSALSTPEP
jgi:hypothetical protein